MTPKIAIVVAKAKNNIIGCSDGLPWTIPEELKYFKKTTLGKPVIMGRKTYESLKGPLTNRLNIVLTRSTFNDPNVVICRSLSEAINIATLAATTENQEEIMVIGGSEIFQQALPLADTIYLTKINEKFDGNAKLKGLKEKNWEIKSQNTQILQETRVMKTPVKCEFLILKRKAVKHSWTVNLIKFMKMLGQATLSNKRVPA